MKKSAILLTLLLVGSIAGTYAVYELYVKKTLRELGDHLEEEKLLQERLTQLEETFFRTKPETVLSTWRSEVQPWADAVDRRAAFFNLGDIPLRVPIPEEERELAKWYYAEVQPKMVREIETKAWESGFRLPDPTFGTPDPKTYGQGKDPPPREISRHLARLEFGKAITEILIDARVKNIRSLEIWPEQVEISGRSGDVKSRTTGLDVTLSMRDFALFIDKLSQEDRYFEVKALRLTNTRLRNKNANLNVQIVLAQAYYAPAKEAREGGGEARSSDEMQSVFVNLFGSRKATVEGAKPRTNKKTWWQKFRQKYLPF